MHVDPSSYHLYFGDEIGSPGSAITFFEWPSAARGYPGIGGTHHYALAVPDEAAQLEWREKLLRAGRRVSPVMDRVYFKSIYTNDPDGHIVELATLGPGFAVDEDVATLGSRLKLPPWLEAQRGEIERILRPLSQPKAAALA